MLEWLAPVPALTLGSLTPLQQFMIAGALASAAVFAFVLFSAFRAGSDEERERATLNRLEGYMDREDDLSPLDRVVRRPEEEEQSRQQSKKRRKEDLLPTVSKWLGSTPIRFLNTLSADLNRMGSNWRASEILYFGIFLSLVVFLIVGVLLQYWVAGVIGSLVALFAPVMLVKQRSNSWTVRFESLLADTLLLMANATQAGYGFQQAMEMVAREGAPPMNEEFSRMSQEVQLGIPIAEAMTHMAERVQNPDFTLAVTAIQISMEVGGGLSEILTTISETVRERVRIRGEIRVLTTQGKVTGIGLAGLPVIMFGLLSIVGSDPQTGEKYVDPLFNGEVYPWGPRMVLGGLVLQAMGGFFINRIINIEV